jgi:hypothetical protein
MEIKYYNASEFESRIKCTIHRTGKLGFSENAIKKLALCREKSIKIGLSENDKNYDVFYIVISDKDDPHGFKLNRAGGYYYANTKALFDKLGINYQDKQSTIIFDIVEVENNSEKMYKLVKREVRRRN